MSSAEGAPEPHLASDPTTLLCPHCLAPIGRQEPTRATPCSTCRLIIGAGRSVTPRHAATQGRRAGAAAGSLISQARRDAGRSTSDPHAVTRDLRRVARDLGVAVARLRMLDYQEAWTGEQSMSTLAEIIASFGSWKAAREAAGEAAA